MYDAQTSKTQYVSCKIDSSTLKLTFYVWQYYSIKRNFNGDVKRWYSTALRFNLNTRDTFQK